MLITPVVLYSLVASFGLRVYYHNRLLTVDGEGLEAQKGKVRRLVAVGFLILCFLSFESDARLYVDWFTRDFSWWKFPLALLVTATLWVAKESTYKVQVLWHHYKSDPGVQIPQMHRPRLGTSMCINIIFWAFFLGSSWLPFRQCMIQAIHACVW